MMLYKVGTHTCKNHLSGGEIRNTMASVSLFFYLLFM